MIIFLSLNNTVIGTQLLLFDCQRTVERMLVLGSDMLMTAHVVRLVINLLNELHLCFPDNLDDYLFKCHDRRKRECIDDAASRFRAEENCSFAETPTHVKDTFDFLISNAKGDSSLFIIILLLRLRQTLFMFLQFIFLQLSNLAPFHVYPNATFSLFSSVHDYVA